MTWLYVHNNALLDQNATELAAIVTSTPATTLLHDCIAEYSEWSGACANACDSTTYRTRSATTIVLEATVDGVSCSTPRTQTCAEALCVLTPVADSAELPATSDTSVSVGINCGSPQCHSMEVRVAGASVAQTTVDVSASPTSRVEVWVSVGELPGDDYPAVWRGIEVRGGAVDAGSPHALVWSEWVRVTGWWQIGRRVCDFSGLKLGQLPPLAANFPTVQMPHPIRCHAPFICIPYMLLVQKSHCGLQFYSPAASITGGEAPSLNVNSMHGIAQYAIIFAYIRLCCAATGSRSCAKPIQ